MSFITDGYNIMYVFLAGFKLFPRYYGKYNLVPFLIAHTFVSKFETNF